MVPLHDRAVERLTCVQMQAERVGRGLENPFQVRLIG
jgi:hypothetical protein